MKYCLQSAKIHIAQRSLQCFIATLREFSPPGVLRENGEIHTAPSMSQRSSLTEDHDEDVSDVLIIVAHDHASNIATLRVWKLKAPYDLHVSRSCTSAQYQWSVDAKALMRCDTAQFLS